MDRFNYMMSMYSVRPTTEAPQMTNISRRYYERELGAGLGPSPSLQEHFGYSELLRRAGVSQFSEKVRGGVTKYTCRELQNGRAFGAGWGQLATDCFFKHG